MSFVDTCKEDPKHAAGNLTKVKYRGICLWV